MLRPSSLCRFAGDDLERRQKELILAHKQQAELEQRLAHLLDSRVMTGASPAIQRLQQQLTVSSHELDLADEELKEMNHKYKVACECSLI